MTTPDDDMLQSYLAGCGDNLATLEQSLLTLELGGTAIDEETVNRGMRAVHAVKTGSGLFDLAKVAELAHETERALGSIRSRRVVPTPERVNVLLGATDKLRALLDNPESSNGEDISAIQAALAGLSAEGLGALEPSRSPNRKLQFLLVEDDFTSRVLLQTFLSRYGECHLAVNGLEAVEAFRAALERGQRYDLICMDIMMPEMDGEEAVRQVRAMEEAQAILPPDGAKIIMTTAVSDLKQVMRSFHDLCDAYLVKPIALAQLLGYMKSYRLVE